MCFSFSIYLSLSLYIYIYMHWFRDNFGCGLAWPGFIRTFSICDCQVRLGAGMPKKCTEMCP